MTFAEKGVPGFDVTPPYWVSEKEVADRLSTKQWNHEWLVGFRDITNTTNELTVITAALPKLATNHNCRYYSCRLDQYCPALFYLT